MTIALAIAAIALAALAMGAAITFAVWYRSSVGELAACRDRLDETETLAATYQSGRDIAVMAHRVAEDQLKTEHNLRVVAEQQRNEALARVRDLLRKYAPYLTSDEVEDLARDAFASVLVVVPLSQQPGNELMEIE